LLTEYVLLMWYAVSMLSLEVYDMCEHCLRDREKFQWCDNTAIVYYTYLYRRQVKRRQFTSNLRLST